MNAKQALNYLLNDLGRTQMWVAEKLCIEQSTVSRLATGKQKSIEFELGMSLIRLAMKNKKNGG